MSTEKETRGSITLDLGGALSIETDEVADLNGKITELSDQLSLVRTFVGMTPSGEPIPELVFKADGSCYPSHLEFPEGQKMIATGIYNGLPYLKSVKFPSTMTSIGDSAFKNCTGINQLDFGRGVTNIAANAFSGCTGIAGLNLPDGLTNIGANAFNGCTGMCGEIVFPEGLFAFSAESFSGCSNIDKIVLPNTIKEIPQYCFASAGIKELHIPGNVTHIVSNAFNGCARLKSVYLENGVNRLGTGSFAHCTQLTTLHIPNTLTSCDTFAFSGCDMIQSVTFENGFNCNGLNIGFSNSITVESMVGMFEALADLTGQDSKTLGVGAYNLNKLTAEQKAIATNKNWVIN